jgi:hypothetical protein
MYDEEWIRKELLPTIGRYVEAQLKPLRERIAALETKGIKFCGTYQRAAEYRRGDVTNYEGAMWVATCDTPPQEVPGKSVCWQLSVKSMNGKDHAPPRRPTSGGPRVQTVIEKRP